MTQIREQLHNLAAGIQDLSQGGSGLLLEFARESGLINLLNTSIQEVALFPEENPNPVIRINPEGSLLYSNRAARSLLNTENPADPHIPDLLRQIAREFAPGCPRQTLEYQAGGSTYTLDVVPIHVHGYINIYARDITEQKLVEDTRERLLRENQRQQALLDAIFDTEPSGLAVITGPDLRIAYANPAYRYICLPHAADITGQTYDEVWSGKVDVTYDGQIREALKTGRPFLVKGFERHYPDGSIRIFTMQVRRMQWGSQPAVLLIMWDTTEQSLSEAKYRDLAESVTDNFVAYDKNLDCIYRNHSSMGFSPVEPDEMIGKNFVELYPALVGSKLHQTYLQVMQTRQPATVEQVYTNPRDGRPATWEVYVYPSPDGITVLSRDITEKKQADSLLKASQQREYARTAELGALMDAVPAVIWIARDRACQDMISNQAGYEFLQVPEGMNISKSAPPDILEKQNFRNFKDGVEIPVTHLPMQVAAYTGTPTRDYEFDVVFDDGRARTLFGNVISLKAEDGVPSGALGAFLDITSRKTTELILQQSQERMQILQEAAADLLAGVDPIDRLNEFFRDFSDKLGLEIYVQYNLAHDGSHLDLGSWRGFPDKYRRLLERLDLGQAVCGTVAQTGKRIIVEDVQHNLDRKTTLIRKLGIRTYACHPLVANGRLLGTLSFGSKKHDRLPPETIELLRTFCHLVASAMDRKQAEQEMQARQQS